jgi:hypothetical protein
MAKQSKLINIIKNQSNQSKIIKFITKRNNHNKLRPTILKSQINRLEKFAKFTKN